MELSVFRNFWDTQPVSGTLEAMVEAIRSDARTRELTTGYRQQKWEQLKNESMLFAVPCIFEGGKSNRDVVRLTGMGMVDFDHVGAEGGVESLKLKVERDAHTLLCYTTISGEGLRVLFRYELDSAVALKQQVQFYRKAFATGNAYYGRLCGADTDGHCKNVTRLTVVAHDPEVYFNPRAEVFTAAWIEEQWQVTVDAERQRKKQERSLKRLQARYEQTIRPEVEAEGAVYAPGSHNDYVMRVGYKLNQFGFCKDMAVQWAVQAFPDYEAAASVVASCYDTQTAEFASRGGQKRARSPAAADGGAAASVEDIQAFLREHISLRFNVITRRVECASRVSAENGGMRGAEAEEWVPITDRQVNSLWTEMSRTQRVWVQDIYRVIESDFVPEFHPFRAYLEGLNASPGSGGCGAIDALAATVTVRGGPEQQALFGEYLRKWLVGMVAGWLDETVVNNVILVLIGEQGAYKTTWFQHLLPPQLRKYFYTKTNAQRMGRDDLLTLAQYGLVCCEELDTMRPAELNQLKAAVTMTSIDERAAYAHYHEHRPHIASFCGTGNNVQFLSDATGNRRWLPFEVEHIRSPRDHPFDYGAIYGEAYTLYRRAFRYWFTREEILRLAEHNRQFETPRLEAELVQLYFRHPGPSEFGEFMSVARAMQIVGTGIAQKLSAVHLGRAFIEQGFRQKRYANTRGYIVCCRSAEEVRGIQQTMACEAMPVANDTG